MRAFEAYWPSGQAVRWRTLSWKEFQKFRSLQLQHPNSSMEVYLALYRAVCLEGPLPEEVSAGIVDYIGEQCLDRNPFNGRYEDVSLALAVKRDSMEYLGHARALVAGLFHYSFEEIDTWDADLFFERLAQAEFLSGRSLAPEDPDAEAKPGVPGPKDQAQKIRKKELTATQQLAMERVRDRKQR